MIINFTYKVTTYLNNNLITFYLVLKKDIFAKSILKGRKGNILLSFKIFVKYWKTNYRNLYAACIKYCHYV